MLYFIGSGPDEHGEVLQNKMRDAGVNVLYDYDANFRTGTCM
jgi:hypothetical protein